RFRSRHGLGTNQDRLGVPHRPYRQIQPASAHRGRTRLICPLPRACCPRGQLKTVAGCDKADQCLATAGRSDMSETDSFAAPTQDDRTMAMLAHVLQIFTWWIGPVVIFIVKQDSKFVRFHALQALLWQVALIVFWMIGMAVWFAAIFSSVFSAVGRAAPNQAPPVAMFVGFGLIWLLFMAGYLSNIVFGILFGIKAGRGEWAGYPLIGR